MKSLPESEMIESCSVIGLGFVNVVVLSNTWLAKKNAGIVDSQTKLHYDNLLDAQIDAACAALQDAGFKKMEVIVTETGWASHGEGNKMQACAALQDAILPFEEGNSYEAKNHS